MATYRGPFDVINKVVRTQGIQGLYRGFGITMLTQSPASALWWSAYGGAQHAIWRCVYFIFNIYFPDPTHVPPALGLFLFYCLLCLQKY
jgi:hypothetical protein